MVWIKRVLASSALLVWVFGAISLAHLTLDWLNYRFSQYATQMSAPGPAGTIAMSRDYLDQLNAIVLPFAQRVGDQTSPEHLQAKTQAYVAVMEFDAAHKKLVSEFIYDLLNGRSTIGDEIGLLEVLYERRWIYLNLRFGADDPVLFMPISSKIHGNPKTLGVLREVYRQPVSRSETLVGVVPKSFLVRGITGQAIRSVAIMSERSVERTAGILGVERSEVVQLVIANEVSSTILASMYPHVNVGGREWPLDKLSEVMRSPFQVTRLQVAEFLSDVSTIAVAKSGLKGALAQFDDRIAIPSDTGEFVGNPNHRYGYTGQFLLASIETHGLRTYGKSHDYVVLTLLAEAAYTENKPGGEFGHAISLLSRMKSELNDEFYLAVRADALQIAHEILDVLAAHKPTH